MDQARDAVPADGDHDGNDDARVPATAPLTASARLRAAREALGMTTADIAARTRITLRHVEALDRGDLASLPGRPYVLGFARNYARVVGLDETELAALARSEIDRNYAPPSAHVMHQFDVDDPAKTPSRLLTWLALVLVVVILAAGGVFWRSYYAPASDLPSLADPDPAPQAASQPATRPVQPVAAAPAAPTGPVVFTAREDALWVKFYDGHGQQLLQKQLALGESYTVPRDAFEPQVWTGRPDALAITIGGRPVAPLSDHRGIVRNVPVSAQALLARGQPGAAAIAPAAPRAATHRRAYRAVTDDSTAPPTAPSTPVAEPAPAPAATP